MLVHQSVAIHKNSARTARTPAAESILGHNVRMRVVLILVILAAVVGAQTLPSVAAVTNAADYSSSVSPGSLATIFGTGLANAVGQAASTPLPKSLSGAVVTVNGIQAPLVYASDKQINFQVPFETAVGPATVVVVSNGQPSSPMTINVAAAAPGLFSNNKRASVQNQDGSLNTSAKPAVGGSTIVAYLTGIGSVNPGVVDGMPTANTPLSIPVNSSRATIGGQNAPIRFIGLTPGFVGLAQANIGVPATLASGDYPLTVSVGNATSISALVSVQATNAYDPVDPDGILPPNNQALTAADVMAVITNAAMAVNNPSMVIAVTDRSGTPLAVFSKNGAPATSVANFSQSVKTTELAVALARTASFFSNSEAPLSSRTVRYISGVHFPPGIMFTSQAALYGIENTNRGCGAADSTGAFHEFAADFIPGKELPAPRSIDTKSPGLGVQTGKVDVNDSIPYPQLGTTGAVNPGGIPLYKGGRLVGGVGVAGIPGIPTDFLASTTAEYAALVGAAKSGLFQFPPAPGVVIVDGIALPFVDDSVLNSVTSGTQLPGTTAVASGTSLSSLGSFQPVPAPFNPSSISTTPYDSPGPTPEGYVVAIRNGPVGGLTAQEVQQIFTQSLATAVTTRAIIRLPLGTRAKFVISVSDLDGQVIGLYRMKDATMFSVDVAVTKSRNVIYFSGPTRQQSDLPGVPINTAVTNRTIEFGSEPFYPPGVDYSTPGPFFSLYKADVATPCTQGAQAQTPATIPYQSGIVFFPGATPLYKNGVLVGGLGISGDGVEQDDFATAGGGVGFLPADSIRADQIFVQGVRLPFFKFPRNPTF